MNVPGTIIEYGVVEASLDVMKNHYDWESALDFGNSRRSAVLGSDVSTAAMTYEDVETVLASCNGESDGDDWIALFRLRDGRYAFLSAGCDRTGWECQAGGSIIFAPSYSSAFRFALTEEARGRMKLGSR